MCGTEVLWLSDQEQCIATITARWVEHQACVCVCVQLFFFFFFSATLGEGRADSKLITAAA